MRGDWIDRELDRRCFDGLKKYQGYENILNKLKRIHEKKYITKKQVKIQIQSRREFYAATPINLNYYQM